MTTPEFDLIFVRCFFLKEQNWTQVGWLKVPVSGDSPPSGQVYNCTFKHYATHQIKFLLNNYNYSGSSLKEQITKQQAIALLEDILRTESVRRVYCHVSLLDEMQTIIKGCQSSATLLPAPLVDRVYATAECAARPNHNNISCVRCILENLHSKLPQR